MRLDDSVAAASDYRTFALPEVVSESAGGLAAASLSRVAFGPGSILTLRLPLVFDHPVTRPSRRDMLIVLSPYLKTSWSE